MPITKASALADAKPATLIIGSQGTGKSYAAINHVAHCDRVLWVNLRNLAGVTAYPEWDVSTPTSRTDFVEDVVKNAANYEAVVIDDLSGLKDVILPDGDVSQPMWLKMGREIQTYFRLIKARTGIFVCQCNTVTDESGTEYMAVNPDLARRVTGFFDEIWYTSAQTTRSKKNGRVVNTGIERSVETNKVAAINMLNIENTETK